MPTLLNGRRLRDGNLASAQGFIEKALAQSPENPALWNNIGVLHARLGRSEQALEAFEKALALDPSREDARKNIAAVRSRSAPSI
jgi:Flp pilus assembly protein TadD